MNTESLKIVLAQRILSISDDSVLQEVDRLLNKVNVIGYDVTGKPVTEFEYKAELDQINEEINRNEALLFTSEEVRKRIVDGNSLV
jgi:hypothetical protein